MGNVARPGIYYLDFPVTVIQTVARSGGFTKWANQEITVVRDEIKAGNELLFKGNTLEFDYDDFISGDDLQNNIFIRSGDIIIVH